MVDCQYDGTGLGGFQRAHISAGHDGGNRVLEYELLTRTAENHAVAVVGIDAALQADSIGQIDGYRHSVLSNCNKELILSHCREGSERN